jgi:hypothetical protein
LYNKRQLLSDNHPFYHDNVEVDLDHETVLADNVNNHYQRDVFSSKEKGILQEHKNNMHFFPILEP